MKDDDEKEDEDEDDKDSVGGMVNEIHGSLERCWRNDSLKAVSAEENTKIILRSLRLSLIDLAEPQEWSIPAASASSRTHADFSFA